MNILAIETSCDETAASIISADNAKITVRSNVIASQVALHAQWGGVVPNLAAREHTKNIIPVLTQCLETAKMTKDDIDLIAVTHGPGLIPALLSGVSAAKSLAYAWHKPLIGIHHIEGHIYANWIDYATEIRFPVLALVVSGGHTQLIVMRGHCDYTIIGETQDDAVGEAFDKVARLLGLSYPGGPIMSARAQAFAAKNIPNDITFPRPMKDSGDYHFSFSGLKTAVLYHIKQYRAQNNLADHASLPDDLIDRIAHAFQEAITDVLITKTLRAAREHNVRSILLAGGVSANSQLRTELERSIADTLSETTFTVPAMDHCLDNAAMIATAAYYRYTALTDAQKRALDDNWKDLNATARTSLS